MRQDPGATRRADGDWSFTSWAATPSCGETERSMGADTLLRSRRMVSTSVSMLELSPDGVPEKIDAKSRRRA